MADDYSELFIKKEEIDKDTMLNILMPRVRLSEEGYIIWLKDLSPKEKIIVYLLSNKILLGKNKRNSEMSGPKEISNNTGVPEGTVKSYTRQLEAENLIKSENGRYYVPNYALYKINKTINNQSQNEDLKNEVRSKMRKNKKNRFNTKNESKIDLDIDRTKYTYINNLNTSLDKSLAILNICTTHYEKNELTPKQIGNILRETFRDRIKDGAIAKALSRDEKYTNRNNSYYSIAQSGIDYIEKQIKDLESKVQREV